MFGDRVRVASYGVVYGSDGGSVSVVADDVLDYEYDDSNISHIC